MNLPREATIQAPVFSQPAHSRREWSDYAHPCMLLEMRRGVRTSLFVLCFLGLHLLVIAALLIQLITPYTGDYPDLHVLLASLFWVSIVPPFLLALPFTSLFTLSQDLHLRTIETMLMTRLGPLGIVIGKWTSKALEAVLMACTLMPYTVIRYYIYGTNPLIDVGHLISLVVISAFMCAVGVALSTVRSVIMRIVGAVLAACCIFPLLQMGVVEIITRSIGPGLGIGLYSMPYVIGMICVLGTAAAIGIAACEIGPPAYNGTLLPRVCALLLAVPWMVAAYCDMPAEGLVALQVMVGLLLFVPMLVEEAGHEDQDGLRPCVKEAVASPTTWRLLNLPGWQSSVWWVVAALLLWLIPLALADSFSLGPKYPKKPRVAHATVSPGTVTAHPSGMQTGLDVACFVGAPSLGALCFPFLVIRALGSLGTRRGLFAIRPISSFLYFICITLICVGFSLMLYVVEPGLPGLFFFIPPTQLSGLMMNGSDLRPDQSWVYLAGIWPVFVLLAASVREYHWRIRAKAIEAGVVPGRKGDWQDDRGRAKGSKSPDALGGGRGGLVAGTRRIGNHRGRCVNPHAADPKYDWTDYVPFCALLETRRAVRTRSFVLCFWGCNLLVMLSCIAPILMPLVDPEQRFLSQRTEVLFWPLVAFVYVLLLPASCLSSVSSDVRSGAMELLLTTGTYPLNVLVGKWLAKLMEALLMCCMLVPYALLNYFINGANPVQQLMGMGMLTIFSAMLCALGISLSAVPVPAVRIVVGLVALVWSASIGAHMVVDALAWLIRGNLLPSFTVLGLFTVVYIVAPMYISAGVLFIFKRHASHASGPAPPVRTPSQPSN